MDVVVGLLAGVAMLATLAVTLFLLSYWLKIVRQAPRPARRRGAALVAANAVLLMPGVILFATQPWGDHTDAAVFLIYIGLLVVGLLGLAIGYAARDVEVSRRRQQEKP